MNPRPLFRHKKNILPVMAFTLILLFFSPSLLSRADDTIFIGRNRIIYEYVQKEIVRIAEGARSDTVIEVPLDLLGLDGKFHASDLGLKEITTVTGSDGKLAFTAEVQEAVVKMLEIDYESLCSALLRNTTFDLYWSRNNILYQTPEYSGSIDFNNPKNSYLSFTSGPRIYIPVSKEYSYSASGSENSYTVDHGIENALKAKQNAIMIVKEASSLSDPDKLHYYLDKILELADYDISAADSLKNGLLDRSMSPWFPVAVFDNDPSTNVVCEGYSKAFQFLCDQTVFKNPLIRSRLVFGTSDISDSGYQHAWNVITMDDGLNYFTDVTSCDTAGAPNKDCFFLLPAFRGSVTSGYTYNIDLTYSAVEYTYKYDPKLYSCYNIHDLEIASEPYVYDPDRVFVPSPTPSPTPEPTVTQGTAKQASSTAKPTFQENLTQSGKTTSKQSESSIAKLIVIGSVLFIASVAVFLFIVLPVTLIKKAKKNKEL